MSAIKKKILAFFGAFNPPTRAHIELAKLAMEQTGRDGVIFIPSKASYILDAQQKSFAFSDEERLNLLDLVSHAVNQPRIWMLVSDHDLLAPVQPRSYETLKWLRDEGCWEPSLLVGSDQLFGMKDHWLHVPEIAQEFGIVVLARRAFSEEAILRDPFWKGLKQYVHVVPTPSSTKWISSTRIRTNIMEAQELLSSLKEDLTDPVYQYMKENYLL